MSAVSIQLPDRQVSYANVTMFNPMLIKAETLPVEIVIDEHHGREFYALYSIDGQNATEHQCNPILLS